MIFLLPIITLSAISGIIYFYNNNISFIFIAFLLIIFTRNKYNRLFIILLTILTFFFFYFYSSIKFNNYKNNIKKITYSKIVSISGKIKEINFINNKKLFFIISNCIIDKKRINNSHLKINISLLNKIKISELKRLKKISFYGKINPNIINSNFFNSYLEAAYIKDCMIGSANIKYKDIEHKVYSKSTINYRFIIQNFIYNFLSKNFDLRYKNIIYPLLTGIRNDLPEDIANKYKSSGIFHILAISGLHIGIILFIVYLFAGFISNKFYIKYIICVIILVVFFIFIGYKISIFRACLMSILILTGILLQKDINLLNIISASILILIFFWPFQILTISFQLSYGALLGISFFYKPLKKIFYFLPVYIQNIFSVTISAQILTVLILSYYFNIFYPYSIITNLMVIPLLGILLPAIYTSFIFAYIPYVKHSVVFINSTIISIFKIIEKISDKIIMLPHSKFTYHTSSIFIIYFIAVILFYFYLKKKYKYYLILFISFIFLAIIFFEKNSIDVKIYCLNVGQGDSCYINIKNKFNLLIDTGIKNNNYQLKKIYNGKTIDYLILTHPHLDHYGNINNIIHDYTIKNIIVNLNVKSTVTTKTWLKMLKNIYNNKINILNPKKLNGIKLTKNIKLFFYQKYYNYDDPNNNSIVCKFIFKNFSMLFTGDCGFPVEKQLLSDNSIKSTVLKVGHHGSRYSSSSIFLKQVKPQLSIISVGYGNKFGHPFYKTLKRIKNINSKILRTDENGSILITTDGESFSVKVSRKVSINL